LPTSAVGTGYISMTRLFAIGDRAFPVCKTSNSLPL